MTVSLQRLLKSGHFGELRAGMAAQQVRGLLGDPDTTGGTSRRYPRPSIYLYGTVELWFSRQQPWGLTSVFWAPGERGALQLPPSCAIQDWDLTPGMDREGVEAFLQENDFTYAQETSPSGIRLLLKGGAQITLEEKGRLYGLCVPME
jgi:hypothetical protein